MLWVGVSYTTDPIPWTGTAWDGPINLLFAVGSFYFAIEPRNK